MAIPSTAGGLPVAREQFIDNGEQIDAVQMLGRGGVVNAGQTWNNQLYGQAMAADNLTATAGGTQANSFAITTPIVRFSVTATLNDSATLPPGIRGMEIVVVNDGAQSMKIWPALGDSINALGANNGLTPLTTTTATIFICTSNGSWHTK